MLYIINRIKGEDVTNFVYDSGEQAQESFAKLFQIVGKGAEKDLAGDDAIKCFKVGGAKFENEMLIINYVNLNEEIRRD